MHERQLAHIRQIEARNEKETRKFEELKKRLQEEKI